MNFDEAAHQEAFRNAALQIDKADLLAILEIRFGTVPQEVIDQIGSMTDGGAVERLVLVAANVPDWTSMYSELTNAGGVFGIVGETFNPITAQRKESDK